MNLLLWTGLAQAGPLVVLEGSGFEAIQGSGPCIVVDGKAYTKLSLGSRTQPTTRAELAQGVRIQVDPDGNWAGANTTDEQQWNFDVGFDMSSTPKGCTVADGVDTKRRSATCTKTGCVVEIPRDL